VISLGPPAVPASATTTVNSAGLVTNLNGQPVSVTGAAGLQSNTPIGVTTVGKPVAPAVAQTNAPGGATVKTIDGQTLSVSYLVNSPASMVTAGLSPAALLAQLPANLQPPAMQFYYDPYTQAQQVEQAALQATGKSSFYNTTGATDSASQASISNLDTAALYGAALQYAEQNNIALGTQLSQQQLALINAPMLWYVEETVPEPGCTATGNGACPTVQALMPEVLLPQNYAVVSADGEISGTNVALNYANSILNTGSISAENLTVNTGALTNEQRSTNIGTIYQEVDGGVAKTTGTVVQQGGFMSAANYSLMADTIDQIGGALQQINADGSVNEAATSQMLADLKSQLGGNFAQSSVSNNLNTTVIADGGMGPLVVFQMVMAVALSVVTAGAGAALVGAVAGTLEGTVANAAFSALVSSLATDAMSGNFSLTGIAESLGVAVVTAGLTNGITFDSATDSLGVAGWTQNLNQLGDGVHTLGQLAGATPLAGTSISQATGSAASNLPQQAFAIAGEATIQAGVQTAIEGGSFLTNLRNSAVSDAAAAGAYDIGTAFDGQPGSLGTATDPAYVLAHAALGCASGAALGSGCAGGAIGGAASAALNPLVDSALGGNTPPAVLTAISMLAGGGLAGALGFNAQGAATAAENETLNNYLNHRQTANLVASLKGCAQGDTSCINKTVSNYQSIAQQQQQQAQNCSSVTDCAVVKNDTLSGYGISASDAQADCQGNAACVAFLTGLGNQDASAKSIATKNWNDVSNAVYMQYAQQALASSGIDPVTAAVLSAATPLDAAGATEGILGGTANTGNNSLLDPKAENHVLYGDGPTSGGHLSGVGNPGKSEFPATWAPQDITNAISDIATDPSTAWSKPAPGNGYVTGTGTINGVDIKVVVDPAKGRIVTGYPTNLPRNPK
jgi:filamentous hemagglutinin